MNRFQTARAGQLWLGALVGFLLVTSYSGVLAQDRSSSRKALKQISVMEQILDQVLIESPNFLVPGRGNARGIFLEEFGVLLTFEASLVQRDWDDWNWKNEFKIEKDENGERIIVIPDPGEDGDAEDEDSGKDSRRRPSEARCVPRAGSCRGPPAGRRWCRVARAQPPGASHRHRVPGRVRRRPRRA